MSYAADLRVVVRGRDFRRLFATRVTSALSDGVFQVGVAGYLLFSPERQPTATAAATAAAVLLLPYSVLGPFVGVFIDRWPRRQILVYAPMIRALAVAGAAGLLAVSGAGPSFYLAALVVLGVNRFFLAALSAGLPLVVPRPELLTANTVSVTCGTLAAFTGAGLGYLLRLVFGAGQSGYALTLLCCAGAYVGAGLIATTMGRTVLGPDLRGIRPETHEALRRVVRGLIDGARHVHERRAAAAALGAIGAHRFLYGIATIMTVLLFRNYFNASPAAGLGGFAVVLVVSGAGYFLAAAITPPITERIRKETWIGVQLAASAIAEVVFVAPFGEVPYVAGAFVLGVLAQGGKLCVDTVLQTVVLDAYRGRVFSFYDMLFNGLFVAGFGVAAALLPPDGRSYGGLAFIAVGYGLAAVAYWLAMPSRPAPLLHDQGQGPSEGYARRRSSRWSRGRGRPAR